MIKELWNKIRKGVKAGMTAVRESDEIIESKIIKMIEAHNKSSKVNWMYIGDQYYRVDNDILERRMMKHADGKVFEDLNKPNNRLAHAKYKNQVDEKVAYILSKQITYKCDDEEVVKRVKECLGKHFQHQLTELGYESTNKGIGWLYCYVNEKGEFKTMCIPSEQCIPVWTDRSHTELSMLIRTYKTDAWEFGQKKEIKHVEVWTPEGVKYYRQEGGLLVIDTSSLDERGEVSHYLKNNQWVSWGKVPFVAFKNNHIEIPDIKMVKSQMDNYDISRSEAANYIEEVKNLIFVLKGYGGQDLTEFMKNMIEQRAIIFDDDDASVETLTPTMDITALSTHYEQLKRDIAEDGQSVNKDLDKFGSAPSGIALKFMYSGLDLKCNLLEAEYKIAFENLLYFVNQYLGISETKQEVDIIFNRSMLINETEMIENCGKSRDIVSEETILGNHPWVSDAEKEKESLIKQRQLEADAVLNNWDKVEVNKDE